MDPAMRAAWRLVNRQACSDVHEATLSLTWASNDAQHTNSTPQSMQRPKAPTCFPPLLTRCSNLRQLRCTGMTTLSSIRGLPARSLQVLDLSGCCSITRWEPLKDCTALQTLTMYGPYRGARRPAALVAALQSLPSLTSLTICHSGWPEGAAGALGAALACLPRLQHLELSSQPLGPRGTAALSLGLSTLTALESLRLADAGIGTGALALAPAMALLTCLLDLDLSGGALYAPTTMHALSQALPRLARLRTLNLARNAMPPAAAAALAAALPHLPHLTALDLSFNSLRVEGLQALAFAFAAMPSLRELLLANCEGHGGGAVVAALLRACKATTPLARLDVSGNCFGRAGVPLIRAAAADALPQLQLVFSPRDADYYF